MEGEKIGRATVEVVPTKHLTERCKERLAGLFPISSTTSKWSLSGTLVKGRRPLTAYLDVDGIGRFVLAESGGEFVGITYLPQIHCHNIRETCGHLSEPIGGSGNEGTV